MNTYDNVHNVVINNPLVNLTIIPITNNSTNKNSIINHSKIIAIFDNIRVLLFVLTITDNNNKGIILP